jgi:hypothetical protein
VGLLIVGYLESLAKLKSAIAKRTRLPAGQVSMTASAKIDVETLRAARKKRVNENVEAMAFTKWRTEQLAKFEDQVAFPAQYIWYVEHYYVAVSVCKNFM